MDVHKLLGDVALYSSCVADGGPRGVRRRGRDLPERYLPGRFLASVRPDVRAALVQAASQPPADWWVRQVIACTEGT